MWNLELDIADISLSTVIIFITKLMIFFYWTLIILRIENNTKLNLALRCDKLEYIRINHQVQDQVF